MNKVLGLITARGGSKGIPGKNLANLAGKPLIAWTLEAAAGSHRLDRTIVSTDDERIARVCRDWGIETPFERPSELGRDDSPHVDVICHALEWLSAHDGYRPDYVMLLQPTSPLRTCEDIDAIIELTQTRNAPAAVSVCETHDHPYLIRRIEPDGTLRAFVSHELAYPRRQDLPSTHALNGALYLVRRDLFLERRTLEPAGTLAYVMPDARSLQVDTPWDLRMCEWALRESGRADVFPLGREHSYATQPDDRAEFELAYSQSEPAELDLRRRSER